MTRNNKRREIVIEGPVRRTARISWDASWPVSERPNERESSPSGDVPTGYITRLVRRP